MVEAMITGIEKKKSKAYAGGEFFYMYFRDCATGKYYRSCLYPSCRNFAYWKELVAKHAVGWTLADLRVIPINGKKIVDADHKPIIKIRLDIKPAKKADPQLSLF